jgi:hypothetical protein
MQKIQTNTKILFSSLIGIVLSSCSLMNAEVEKKNDDSFCLCGCGPSQSLSLESVRDTIKFLPVDSKIDQKVIVNFKYPDNFDVDSNEKTKVVVTGRSEIVTYVDRGPGRSCVNPRERLNTLSIQLASEYKEGKYLDNSMKIHVEGLYSARIVSVDQDKSTTDIKQVSVELRYVSDTSPTYEANEAAIEFLSIGESSNVSDGRYFEKSADAANAYNFDLKAYDFVEEIIEPKIDIELENAVE